MKILGHDVFDWKHGRPQLYLNIFHRRLKGLSVVGYIEFASAGYLRGASTYVDSPRHANYVDVTVYRRVLSEIREIFGWPDPSDELYRPLDLGGGDARRSIAK